MMSSFNLPPTSKRVRMNTHPSINSQIDRQINLKEDYYREASITELSQRIKELDNEWDTERTLEVSFASLVILSTLMGTYSSKKWYAVGGVAAGFMLQHALQGWCPPLSLIRRLGIRTADEINREKTIVKFYRGDYDYFEIAEESEDNSLSSRMGKSMV